MKPIVLDSVNKSIVAVMSGAASTTDPDFTAHFADHTTTTFTEGANDGVLNGISEVTLVAAPSASTQRVIKEITISNVDDAAVTVEIFYKDGANSRRVWYGTIVVNGTFTLDGLYDENGSLQTSIPSIPLHSHTDPANGGTLSAAAIASGQLVAARGGLGADASAFSGLIKMAAGAASVATPGTDYLAPGITHTDISDFSEAVDDRVDALTVAGVGIGKVYDDTGNSLTINALTFWRQPVRVVAVSNVSVSSAPASIDSVTLSSGDRVLLTAQSTGSQNGPWVFNGTSSAMTRPTDYAAASTTFAYLGQAYYIREGSTGNAKTVWMLTTSSAITIDTTSTSWALMGIDGAQITAGTVAAARLGTMTGDSGSGGAKGAVPAPAAGDATKFLTGAGTFAAAGGVILQANTRLTGSAASIAFPSISSSYSHLQLKLMLRSDRAAQNNDGIVITYNSDTGSNYHWNNTRLNQSGTGGGESSDSDTGIKPTTLIPAAASTSGYFAVIEITIFNYASASDYRMMQGTYSVFLTNSATNRNGQISGVWRNTANAISSITITPLAGSNFVTGCTYQLIGIN